MKKYKYFLIGFLLFLSVLTTWNPLFPHDQLLQHIGTLGLVIILIHDAQTSKQWLGFLGIFGFTVLHIIGARYVYSNVPYYEWFPSLFSYTERNHFDRFVHLGFGFLIFPYLFQFVSKWGISSIFKTLLITWMMLQSMSLIYELLEWNLTLMASPEDAETYNGQQGDLWDAQKDMALALLGSTFVGLIYLFFNFRKNKHNTLQKT